MQASKGIFDYLCIMLLAISQKVPRIWLWATTSNKNRQPSHIHGVFWLWHWHVCALQVAACRSGVELWNEPWRGAGGQPLAEPPAEGEAVAQGGPAACSWALTSTKWTRSSPLHLGARAAECSVLSPHTVSLYFYMCVHCLCLDLYVVCSNDGSVWHVVREQRDLDWFESVFSVQPPLLSRSHLLWLSRGKRGAFSWGGGGGGSQRFWEGRYANDFNSWVSRLCIEEFHRKCSVAAFSAAPYEYSTATICLNRQQLRHHCQSFQRSSMNIVKEYSGALHLDCIQSFPLRMEDTQHVGYTLF